MAEDRVERRNGAATPSGLLLSESAALVKRPRSLLHGLTQRESAEVLKHGTRRTMKAGSTLFIQGGRSDAVYLIERGQIRVFYTGPSGKQLTLAYWTPGNFIGDPGVLGESAHFWSAVAASDSTVVVLSGATLRNLVLDMPPLGLAIINSLIFKMNCYSTVAQMLATRSAMERLAHVLLQLSENFGVQERGGTLITATLTHGELSQLVGSTRQWVTQTLKRLEDRGVLTHSKGRIRIINAKALLALHRATRRPRR